MKKMVFFFISLFSITSSSCMEQARNIALQAGIAYGIYQTSVVLHGLGHIVATKALFGRHHSYDINLSLNPSNPATITFKPELPHKGIKTILTCFMGPLFGLCGTYALFKSHNAAYAYCTGITLPSSILEQIKQAIVDKKYLNGALFGALCATVGHAITLTPLSKSFDGYKILYALGFIK